MAQQEELLEFVAPDGGWGWMIVLASGISYMVLISIFQTFGLTFKGRFEELQYTVTDTTSIMSLNSSSGMILGIFSGPLLKKFGYRKVAIFGGILFVSGFFYTAFAESYIAFIISYGVITSIGISVSMSSFSLALNTYFKLKRSIASSISITIMGLGPIVMPILITHLLSSYGFRWTVLILSAFSLNTFVGAFLLHPIKWHLKRAQSQELKPPPTGSLLEAMNRRTSDAHSLYGTSYIDPNEFLSRSISELNDQKWKSQNSLHRSKIHDRSDFQKVTPEGKLTRKLRSVTSLDNEDYGDMMRSTLHVLESSTPKGKPMKYASMETLDEMPNKDKSFESEKLLSRSLDVRYTSPENSNKDQAKETEPETGIVRKTVDYLKNMYDVDILMDPIFINLMIGLAAATVGEIIFSLLTPFILSEFKLDLDEVALCMSVTAIVDIIFRLIAPYFANYFKINSRFMYLIALCLLLVARLNLFLASGINGFIAVSVGLGVGKGFRTVYWTLVIPDYVPLSKLPSALAFQSLVNGLSLIISGPIIGMVVAKNDNNYTNVIFVSNVLTLATLILWGTEFLIIYLRRRKLKKLPS